MRPIVSKYIFDIFSQSCFDTSAIPFATHLLIQVLVKLPIDQTANRWYRASKDLRDCGMSERSSGGRVLCRAKRQSRVL